MAKITDFNEIKRKRRKKKLTRNFMMLILLLAVSLSAAYIFSKHSFSEIKSVVSNTFSTNKADGYPISTPGGKVLDVGQQDGNFMIINDTNIYSYTPAGADKLNIQHRYQRPLVSTAGKKTVIYTRGGTQFTMYDDDKLLLEKQIDDSIYNIDAEKSGKVVIASTSQKGRSKVSVFNKNGKELFVWTSYDKTAIMAKLDDNSSQVAVGSIHSAEGELVSSLTLLKTDDKKFNKEYLFEGELILSVNFKGKNIEVITDKQAVLFDKDGSIIKSYSFNDEPLNIFDLDDGHTVLLLGDYRHNRSFSLVVLNDKNEELSKIKLKDKILDLKVENGVVYTLENNRISCYSEGGELMERIEANDVYELEPIDGNLYTLSQNSIKKINTVLISVPKKGGDNVDY